MLMYLSADFARDSETTTMCPCGLKARYTVQIWTVYRRQVKKLHPFVMRHLLSIMMITWMDKVKKQGNTQTERSAIYGRSSDQKECPVDWIPHEDVTRHATKADSLLSSVSW